MYYVLESAEMADGSNPRGLFGYDTVEGATIHYHQAIASMMVNEQVSKTLAMVLDEEGNTILKENWTRAIKL